LSALHFVVVLLLVFSPDDTFPQVLNAGAIRRSAAVVDHLVSKDLALFDGGQLLQQLLQANIFVT